MAAEFPMQGDGFSVSRLSSPEADRALGHLSLEQVRMYPATHPWDVPLHPSAGAAQVAFLSQSTPARES